MTDGIDIRHKNLLRRSFHIHMVPRSGMRVYPGNTRISLRHNIEKSKRETESIDRNFSFLNGVTSSTVVYNISCFFHYTPIDWLKQNFQTTVTTRHGMLLQLNSDNGHNKFAPLPRIDSIKDEILTPYAWMVFPKRNI